MCKKFNSLIIFGLVVNVILLVLSFLLVAMSSVLDSQVDLKGKLGHKYEIVLPRKTDFVDMMNSQDPNQTNLPSIKKQKQKERQTKDLTTQFNSNIQKLDNVAHGFFFAVILFGFVLIMFGLLGIVVALCGTKSWDLIVVYLSLLAIVVFGCLFIAIYVVHIPNIQGLFLTALEDMAFKNDYASRYFMAVMQYKFQCCAVYRTIDYYCHGLYDYKCNPGCLTTKDVWFQMIADGRLPLCYKSNYYMAFCGMDASKEQCNKRLNTPMPIKAKNDSFCKTYKDLFETDGSAIIRKNFSEYDDYNENHKGDPFQVRGSLYSEKDPDTILLYKHHDILGCGYVIWEAYPVKIGIFVVFFVLLLITILLALLVGLCVASLIIIRQNKIKEQKEKEEKERKKKEAEKRRKERERKRKEEQKQREEEEQKARYKAFLLEKRQLQMQQESENTKDLNQRENMNKSEKKVKNKNASTKPVNKGRNLNEAIYVDEDEENNAMEPEEKQEEGEEVNDVEEDKENNTMEQKKQEGKEVKGSLFQWFQSKRENWHK